MFQKTKRRLALSYAALFLLILTGFGAAIYWFVDHHLFAKVDQSLTNQANVIQSDYSFYSNGLMFSTNVSGVGIGLGTQSTSAIPSNPATLEPPDSVRIPIDPNTSISRGTLISPNTMTSGGTISLRSDGPDMKSISSAVPIDPRMFLVEQDAEGHVVATSPALNIEPAKLQTLVQGSADGMVTTVQVSGHSYRMIASPNTQTTMIANATQATLGKAAIYAVISVDSEMNMLTTLLKILAVAGGVGIILVVLAGYYMAERALVPIRTAWERQQQFVADASHELRTPLAVMGTNAELLLRHPTHTIEQESHVIAPILKEVKRLSKLVAQLLTLARSDSNQLELQRAPMRLNEQVSEVVEPFRPLCEMNEIELETGLDVPIDFNGDGERLRQLVVILMDNALQHTPEGGTIRVLCRRVGHSIQLQMTDTGRGIAAKDLAHIFDRFYRGQEARSRSDGGTGLGLSIAKWIAEKHGGSIEAASTLGQGTTMTVWLPLQAMN